jgi:Ulp1 family protease
VYYRYLNDLAKMDGRQSKTWDILQDQAGEYQQRDAVSCGVYVCALGLQVCADVPKLTVRHMRAA